LSQTNCISCKTCGKRVTTFATTLVRILLTLIHTSAFYAASWWLSFYCSIPVTGSKV